MKAMVNIKYKIDASLIMDMTVREIERIDYQVVRAGGSANAGIEQKTAIAAMYTWKQIRGYRFTDEATALTIRELVDIRRKTGNDFLHMHRLNYMTYRIIQDVYDWLEDKKRVTLNVKRYWKKIERTFSDYQSVHRDTLDKATWATVQDHMRLASDLIMPDVDAVDTAVRDFLIQKRTEFVSVGQRDDIPLLVRTGVALLFVAVLRNTRRQFFSDVIKQCGVDFSMDFRYADISPIAQNFVRMMEQLGVRFSKDKDGDFSLKGVSIAESNRVSFAWDRIVAIVTDDEKMNDAALAAINMNPKTKAEYEKAIAEEDEKELNDAMGDLRTKFKVGSL